MQLTLVTNFNNSMWTDSYTTAVADWQESDALNLNDGGTSDGACDPADGTIAVCAASYGNTPWIGLAQIWTRGPPIFFINKQIPALDFFSLNSFLQSRLKKLTSGLLL